MVALSMLAACAGPRPSPVSPGEVMVGLSPGAYPALLDAGDPASLASAVQQSRNYLSSLPPDSTFTFGPDVFTAAELTASMAEFHDFLLTNPPPARLREYVNSNFRVYAAPGSDADGGVLYTGYYTPELMASPVEDQTFRYPVYALPDDLITAELGLFRKKYDGDRIAGRLSGRDFVPYYTRSEIDGSGALTGRGLEIAWCADPADVFFMQVQGSGVLVFQDGTKVHANYAGSNGREYRSIGSFLIQQGKAEIGEMSLAFLRSYLKLHPDEAQAVMDHNESYVFFYVDETGPFGSLGTPVTPERTIATDPTFYPQGALAFIETEVPSFTGHLGLSGWEPYSRFVLNQDRGGAIKGPGRADIYFGFGEPAQIRAGYMRRTGRLYFLAPVKAPR